MQAISTASARPSRLLGLLTPLVILVGVVALLLLPNLLMHRGSGPMSSSMVPAQGHAASQSAAAGMAPPVVR
jgi:hypothetical protein